MPLLKTLAVALLAYLVLLLWLELRHRLRPRSPLTLTPREWAVTARGDDRLVIEGLLELHNPHRRMEVMVPELEVRPVLIGQQGTRSLRRRVRVIAEHPDSPARPDGYWVAYIIKAGASTQARVRVTLQGTDRAPVEVADTLWLEVNWVNYGPFGRLPRRDGVLVPLRTPAPLGADEATWQEGDGFRVLPLGTHLLGPLDDPLAVLQRYAAPLIRPGDILTIGETPLAVMQGRFHHPATVQPGWLARALCRVFHPTSSLATACGIQSLIDLVGPARVLSAWVLGSLLKLVGSRGGFYRLAGEQARLIDDITGTTPPYDQTIVLGPLEAERCCRSLAESLGVHVAVVDVNDLGRVKVLASDPGCDHRLLAAALRPNPAGNADQRTPLVLVRPA
ncbi:F420-0:Gamma-glutamyl ligase [Synechococcus sp. RSCCF101]|uniref:F420-0:Gamma-glutamyl ligase n=1 Tax=Synechococcus sp. RSCCF101 TaxID=2511069 RepID=UPI001249272C|nr:F420-0:Gamma-glutamyl ligase [Synechococcus sp. RSCCF101]QEY31657.1 F420-0:Gamma-glutamyl ligase [Synechococcus sp. RSCCF101]